MTNETTPLPEPAKKAVYANASNTSAVRKGYEMGGYLISPDYYTDDQVRQLLAAELAKLEGEITKQAGTILQLADDLQYIAGIAARGEIAPIPKDKKVVDLIREYVKSLEAERDTLCTLLTQAREALKELSFAAQTTGGTVGRDDDLVAAISVSTSAIAAIDKGLKP